MAPTPLTGRNRDRLLALLAGDRPDPSMLLPRLRELGKRGDFEPFSAALSVLAGLCVPESDAERLFLGLLQHHAELGRGLRRDPGLGVAAMDYFSTVEPRIPHPGVIESSLHDEPGERRADPFTGLVSRRYAGATVARELRRARRHRRTCSFLLLGLDRFEPVRQAHGELFGDLVLEQVAGIVRRSIREADAAFRVDGAILGVLLPESAPHGAAVVGERIRGRAEAELGAQPLRGRALDLTVSGGIACYPRDAQTADTLVARARAALEAARQAGGNRVVDPPGERRAWMRYPVERSMEAFLEAVHAPSATPAVAVNLSRTGALLRTAGAFVADEPIRVRLRFARAGSDGERVLAGRVVRVDPPGVGVHFDAPLSEELLPAARGAR